MKILKETGNYLKRKINIYYYLGLGMIIFSAIILIYTTLLQNFILIIYSIIILIIGGHFLKESLAYNQGLIGENIVNKCLQKLDDTYYLINDVKLPDSYGNIDHVLLGPNGIFVIETKNFEGRIRCEGDNWYQYKQEWKNPEEYERKSLSKQVKGNALRLKQFIESKNIFKKTFKFWVDGVVVFTSDNLELNLNHPTVPIIKIKELYGYIKSKKSKIILSSQELESIGKSILIWMGVNEI